MNVYRVDPNGQASVVAENLRGPNGLAFSPDETKLYIVESRATPNRLILVFDVVDGTKLANARTSSTPAPARPTGSASTSTATCGAAGAWAARNSTVS